MSVSVIHRRETGNTQSMAEGICKVLTIFLRSAYDKISIKITGKQNTPMEGKYESEYSARDIDTICRDCIGLGNGIFYEKGDGQTAGKAAAWLCFR